MIDFTWTCYQGAVLEREKTSTFDYNITFTHTLVPSIENTYKTIYTKGQVKPKTCYLTTKKKVHDYFRSLVNDLKEDEERTCSDEIKGKGKKNLNVTATQGIIKEEREPNLD
jgi:hypothetical protein